MHWICKALLRYRRNGTGPLADALALPEDPAQHERELEVVAGATALLMKILSPAEQPNGK